MSRKPRPCPTPGCKNERSRTDCATCRDCWKEKTGQQNNRKKYFAQQCGHECARANPLPQFCDDCYHAGLSKRESVPVVTFQSQAENETEAKVIAALRVGTITLEDLASKTSTTQGQALDAMLALRERGLNVQQFGGRWSLERTMPVLERTFTYISRPDNTYVFGSASDAHLGSKYSREDVLDELYNEFERKAVDRVFNAGNWIDGEDDKNRYDLAVHGLEPQVQYLADRFPKRDGIVTYAIWGEDHEGWYSRREAIDVGRFAEGQMRSAGREDWIDLGFIEARVDLVNTNTGKKATLVVMHPGGGSSYAYSYRSQKIVESFSGGEKPSVLIIGHYHKLNCNIIRNVWTVQAGCQQDQTVFMRKKGLEAHVGGMVLTLEQDPESGAIFRCVADQMIYYDRAYYNDRWSKTREVVKAPRYLGGADSKPVTQ